MVVIPSRELGQAPILVFLTPRQALSSHTWSDCIGYRIEIVCLIGTLTTLQTHTMKPLQRTAAAAVPVPDPV